MHKVRYRPTQRNRQPLPWREFQKAAAAGVAAGICAGAIKYHTARAKLEKQREELRKEFDKNDLRSHSRDSMARNNYGEALVRSTPYERAVYESTLKSGGTALGEMQWVAMKNLFTANNFPFSTGYIDLSSPDLLTDRAFRMSALDPQLKKGLTQWMELRFECSCPCVTNVVESELTLLDHVVTELSLTRRENALSAEANQQLPPAVIFGAAVGIICFQPVLVALLILAKRKAAKARMREALDAAKACVPPANGQQKKPRTERTDSIPSLPQSISPSKEKKSDPPPSSVDAARQRLADEFGQDVSDSIFAALNGKLSATLTRKIADGDHSSLVQLVVSSKKALELRGYDANAIVSALRGEEPQPSAAPDGMPETRRKRKRHPLDLVKRWGWKPNNFHNLLNKWGFDTSEVGGGGHCIIKYKDEALRQAKGIFVQIPHRTSGTEITPGLANAVLKHCADFLVKLEGDGKC